LKFFWGGNVKLQKTAFFAKTPKTPRPEDSKNVVLFVRATFLTGVIAAQSQQRAEKVGASPKIGNVKKK